MPTIYRFTQPLVVDQARYDVLIKKYGYFAVPTLDTDYEKSPDSELGSFSSFGVSVKSAPYFAKGDGVTNDTAAIAAAIAAVNNAGGGTVFFPRGVYMTTTQTIHSKMVFQGESRDASELKLIANTNNDLVKTKDYDILTTTEGIGGNMGCFGHSIRSMTLNANRAQQTSQSRCYASFGWKHSVYDVEFINGHTIGVTSEWTDFDGTSDRMEALWSNFRIWNYGGVSGGAVGLDWNGPHDSICSDYVVATLDSTIRPYQSTYGATPIDAGGGATATFPGSGTFTFTTTQAASTTLFPESGGWFLVPHDVGNSNFSTISYTGASTVGSVTTFTGCTGAASRVVGTSAPNVGIIKPTYGVLVNRIQKGEYGFVHSQGHIWGRNHIGLGCKMLTTPYYDIPIFSQGCHVEGAFLANVIMSSKSVFEGGSIYGTNGQTGNEYEVGLLLSLPNRGANNFKISTLVYNIGKVGSPASIAPIVNVNSETFDLNVRGTTNTPTMLNGASVYRAKSHARVVCENDHSRSISWFPSAFVPIFGGGVLLNGGTAGVGPKIIGGSGVPANTIAGSIGDLYIRSDGTVGSLIYRATALTSGLVTTWTVVL